MFLNDKNRRMKHHLMALFIFFIILSSLSYAVEEWTIKTSMTTARYGLSTSVVNGKIYAIGGRAGNQVFSIVEEYDPTTDTWTRKTNMPTGRVGLSTGVVDGKIYAIGGNRIGYGPTVIVEQYDPVTDQWTRKADMPTERSSPCIALSGKIYVIGGTPRGVAWGAPLVEIYDPATDTWTKGADMPTARGGLALAALNGKIYAIGGTGPRPGVVDPNPEGSVILSTVEEYDPTTDTWTRKADMPTPRTGLCASVVNGKIYVIGGEDDDLLSVVEEYDPATDTWAEKPGMPTPRTLFSASTIGVKIYAIGGRLNPWPLVTDAVEEYRAAPWGFAEDPSPADGSLNNYTWVKMGWHVGDLAVSHDVYFGDNFDDVNTGNESTFQGNQTEDFFLVGLPGYAYPNGVVPGTTYYWRVDEVNHSHPESPWKGPVWSFTVQPKTAYNPFPPDGAKYVDPDVMLSWTGGFGSVLHNIYIGENPADVKTGTGGTSKGLVPVTDFTPGNLSIGTTYYWRIDESDGIETQTGDIWSFKTIPDMPITDPDLVGWWKFDEGYGTVVIDSSGHSNHSKIQGNPVWTAGYDGVALEFDGNTNYLDVQTGLVGSDAGSVTGWIKTKQSSTGMILYGSDGTIGNGYGRQNELHLNMRNDGAVEFFIEGGSDEVSILTSVVNDDTWYHIAATWDSTGQVNLYLDGALVNSINHIGNVFNFSGRIRLGRPNANERYYEGSLDDLRLFKKVLTLDEVKKTMQGDPALAWNEYPLNGSLPNIKDATPLRWSPGENTLEHDIYFATDRDAVDNADVSDTSDIYRGRQSSTTYTPPEGVEWGGGPYYWRIDQVNIDGTVSTGRIWTFTVADFILIDDFEDYDSGENRIWFSWHDGLGYGVAGSANYFAGNGTGSRVGDENTNSYTEETIVHGGSQSMPVFYGNNQQGKLKYSEVEMTLNSSLRDWTQQGVTELSLWFRGYPASVGSFVESPAGTFTMTGSGADIWNQTDEFYFAYKVLTGAGSIIAKIESISDTNRWAKAGVMIRNTLDAGSEYAFMCATPDSGIAFQYRFNVNTDSEGTTQADITAPRWVKLERNLSGQFTAYHSTDGLNWQIVENALPQNIKMNTDAYIGLALTSHDDALTCQATFSNVQIDGVVSSTWMNQDIGIAGNSAEPLYVAITNSIGEPAVVYHNDPAATNIDTWTEWNIDLSEFADRGVDLTNVDTIAIGFGNRSNPQPGGSGKIYFDDIRLCR